MAVNTFIFGEMFYLFNCRSLSQSFWQLGIFSNRWLWAGVFLMTGLQVLFTYLPAFNVIFQSHPLGPRHWAMVLGYSLLVSGVIGMEKGLRKTG